MLLRNLKTKEQQHTGTELPKTLRHAPKELAKKSLLTVEKKGEEQLLQAAQSGMSGTEQTTPEKSAGNQLLGKTGEWSRDIAAIGGDMLRHASARAVAGRREHRMEQRMEEAIPHSESGRLDRTARGKKGGRPRARARETARMPKAGTPAVKAERQPVKTPRAIHAATQQTPRAAKQAAQRAKQAARVAQKTARTAGRALVNTVKGCIAAIKSLAAAVAAGGGLALFIVLLICLIALVAGSAFGIFFSAEPTGKGIALKQAVQTLNEEYYRQLKGIEATIPHDRVEYISADDSVSIHWEDVLAVFAADMAADEHGQQVVALDDAQLEQLRAVLADMHQISHSTRTVEHEEEIITTDEEGSKTVEWVTVSETILEIEVAHKTTDEMATAYGFTPRQNEQLTLLEAPQYDALWMELLGGYVSGGGQIIDPDSDWVGTGIFAWPLPQSFTITSPFGYRQDPFTGEWSYHSGTDIAAPQGTPILAAADGTVTIANGTDPWGGSYGYHVKIDHGGGMETLYAHCSSICVTPAQQVQQGEVIGYVGSTGNSTGDHLHFEVWENGKRTNALDYYVYFFHIKKGL
ncbi:M23 family metallopeptidase [Ruthenibacterium lactatiformans]|nr:M23 family metallopeptidase [Ruthenibacterium lactatiformans]